MILFVCWGDMVGVLVGVDMVISEWVLVVLF